MKKSDIDAFVEIWAATQETYDKQISDAAMTLAFKVFEKYELSDIRKAINIHLVDPDSGKFAPKPADIIGTIEAENHDGRLDADEAWSLALKSFDEYQTVVLNDEIAGALELARDIYNDGDKTGARMAFRKSYERLVAEARKRGDPVKWWPSMGFDVAGRQAALEQAVINGYLSAGHVAGLLPAPMSEATLKLIRSKVPALEKIH